LARNAQVDESASAQDRILGAAAEVLAERGYTGAGVQEIIERAGTSKGNFYFHFASKEAMVDAVVDRTGARLLRKVQKSVSHQPTPLHRVSASIDVLMATFSRQRRVAQVLLMNIMGHGKATDKRFLPVRERFSRAIKEELDAAVRLGQIEPLDTALVSQMWVGALHEVILRWLLTGEPSPLTRATPSFKVTFLRSLGADPAFIRQQINETKGLQ
jgi:AcrR family transcriptional regulator